MELTQEMRTWIRSYPPTSLLYDFVLDFKKTFRLSNEQAGELLKHWISEVL